MRMSSSTFQSLRWRMGMPPCTLALLVVTTCAYVLQLLAHAVVGSAMEDLLGLSVSGLLRGQFWQVLTYLLLHGNPIHLLLNMFMLAFLGAEVERAIGARHFLVLYLLSGVLGGAGWLYLTYPYEGICVGASGAIFGVLSAYATLFPHREITFLLFLILPLTMRAWVLAVGFAVVQLLLMLSPGMGGIAYAAHLAGAVAGFVYTLVVFRRDGLRAVAGSLRDTHRARRDEQARRRADDERVETDRILDKVAREGIGALTDRERQALHEASSRLRPSGR